MATPPAARSTPRWFVWIYLVLAGMTGYDLLVAYQRTHQVRYLSLVLCVGFLVIAVLTFRRAAATPSAAGES